MAYTTIDDPSAHFQTKIYAGTGSAQSLTNDGNSNLKPDWIWFKNRSTTSANSLIDSSRGASVRLRSDATDAESSASGNFVSFNTDGFSIDGSGSGYNTNSENFVAWQWKANGGTATATISESGSNPAASVQANTTAGFSIITYTGTGSEGTIAHGLGATPKFIIAKNRDAGEGWIIDSRLLTGNSNGTLHFNTDAEYTGGSNQFGTHSSTNITIKTAGNINTDGQKYVAYCFTPIQGYSKFGSYTGNANADGTFVYTGFAPAWVMVKNTESAIGWVIQDNTRSSTNPRNKRLFANITDAEATDTDFDFLSNGFKLRNSGNTPNKSGEAYIYMAFAEHPFVSSKGVPVTAR